MVAAAAAKSKGGFALDEDDYIPLDKLCLPLSQELTQEDGSFTLCLWMYLVKASRSGTLIRQACEDSEEALPFLTMDHARKLTLHRLSFFSQGSTPDHCFASSEQACPVEKWVHIGCEISSDIIRIHIDGVVVGEKSASHLDCITEGNKHSIILVGGDCSSDTDTVQSYVHYAQVLPQPAVTNHYVKHPPLELSLDGSTGASDDHEVEEGGDGVWSVVGGKASCRRNFALDVVLLDALGRSVHKEMELIALLVYADNGAPVEKPKDDAEAPLLTTFDGVEFPSTDRAIKLVHGRASFKLKISQLSSKCDNRLFRVCFDPPSAPNYPFLRAFSRPIRCVSRNRNSRTPAAAWKRSNPSLYQVDSARSPEEIILEAAQANNDHFINGDVGSQFMHGPKLIAGQPLVKRICSGTEKNRPEHSGEMGGVSSLNGDGITSPTDESHKHTFASATFGNGCSWPGNIYVHNMQDSSTTHLNESDNMGEDDKAKQEEENTALTCPDVEAVGFSKLSPYRIGAIDGGLPDFCIFRYCLDNMYSRAAFLKAAILCKSDQELSDFAKRISQYSGCHHNGYQIFIAKKLIQDGNELWKQVSSQIYPVPWSSMVKHIEEQFLRICASTRRHFTSTDKEFLRQIARCSEYISREEFDRLWQWIYPVALSLSNPQVRATWELEEPKWIEGMIFREEAETLLRTEEGLKAGTFILRFASSRSWPHPDAGAMVVSFVSHDFGIHHKLLSLDKSSGFSIGDKRPLSELLLLQNELSQLYRRNMSS